MVNETEGVIDAMTSAGSTPALVNDTKTEDAQALGNEVASVIRVKEEHPLPLDEKPPLLEMAETPPSVAIVPAEPTSADVNVTNVGSNTVLNNEKQQGVKRKRNLPGTPDPDAEVVALSPTTLMATHKFTCEVCGRGFQREQNLQLHKRGHNLPGSLKPRANKDKEIGKRTQKHAERVITNVNAGAYFTEGIALLPTRLSVTNWPKRVPGLQLARVNHLPPYCSSRVKKNRWKVWRSRWKLSLRRKRRNLSASRVKG
ncbi:hypothetical protein R1flu_012750 [Riccia fluitans]|uniref:C2H2-type domain-containing protein n=1 Tax=Riccia fluitans TaxID=41844 RepID=A0ABD1ZBH1_9MARC